MVFGQFLPGNGIDVQLNQLAFAGWAGLFVTGLNLIPIGQLDGGHVAYTLFAKAARRLYWPLIIGLVAIAIFTQTWSWTLWIFLLFFFGRVYAEPLDDVTPLDPRRRLLAYLTLFIFVLVFVPIPIILVNP
jgi:membrane-associated protease RseP (regulator of RpoE activity)